MILLFMLNYILYTEETLEIPFCTQIYIKDSPEIHQRFAGYKFIKRQKGDSPSHPFIHQNKLTIFPNGKEFHFFL